MQKGPTIRTLPSLPLIQEQNHYDNFLRLFEHAKVNPENFTFYLNGKKANFEKVLGNGDSKRACSFGNTVCLIPSKAFWGGLSTWQRIIREEQLAADEVAKTGVRTQTFQISPLRIQDNRTNKLYSIDVLVTKNFNSLAKEENITILDCKNESCGKAFTFYKDSKKLKDVKWNKEMFQSLMNEVALALSYNVQINGDAGNYILSHPQHADSPLRAHLFVYDFTSVWKPLTFPYLNYPPKLPHKDKLISEFLVAVGNILYKASDDELEQLGFEYHGMYSELSNFIEYFFKTNAITQVMVVEALSYAKNKIALNEQKQVLRPLPPLPFKTEKEAQQLHFDYKNHRPMNTDTTIQAAKGFVPTLR